MSPAPAGQRFDNASCLVSRIIMGNTELILAAYTAFGLEGDEDFDLVRKRFRALIKEVHPDTAGEDPKLLARLQRLLQAYEVLKLHAPRRFDLEITPDESRKGGLRTVKIDNRDFMVRLPVAVKTGTIVTPIGDPQWRVHVHVRDTMIDTDTGRQGNAERMRRDKAAQDFAEQAARLESDETAGMLKTFYDTFVKKSPAARLVSWARRGAA